ncbi:MAG: hypothetical protein A2W29_01785 [Gemmatimonadetes bacterium RBG_16_66_8]|nr:MAG: hypothetical protein A2W29_01785 [Gemmatimonadetes bacterium RBG_16_66_8]
MALKMAGRAALNMWRKRPLTVSFEVTHSCTANCWHCNWGGPIKETRRTPEEYAAIYREIQAPVVNISGGEPLARGDLDDVIRAIATPGGLPWIVVVTNGSNLTPERFLRLKRAGMHQLSVSIDFPDDRHSSFRRIPGLFEHMNTVIPGLVKVGDPNDITLNCCITAWNYKTVPDIVRLAARWGVWLNFSTYSALRMDDQTGLVKNNGKAESLKRVIQEVIDLRQQGFPVYTVPSTMWKFYEFMIEGHTGGCQAGYKFVVINPDGRLTPCAMVMAYYNDVESMQREFSCKNTCGACYISTRANAEKSARELLADNVQILSRYVPLRRKANAPSA